MADAFIFIIGTTIAFFATIGTAVSKTYGAYMVARIFQGLGASPGGTVGMAIINEYVLPGEVTIPQLTNRF
jgi:MFS family permease